MPTTNDVTSREIPLFKTERKYNININALAAAAKDDIKSVQTIAIPAIVRNQQRRGESCEAPTISEIGGGNGAEFCQVVANTEALPIPIDDVVFVNNDPAYDSISHGTAAVSVGNYFAVAWKRHTNSVVLIYRIVDVEEYPLSAEQLKEDRGSDRGPLLVAKLTSELAGWSTSTWRGHRSSIPEELNALYTAATTRLLTGNRYPIYMDVIRVLQNNADSNAIAEKIRRGDYGDPYKYEPDTFMENIYLEVIDIRKTQYDVIPTGAKRKVEPLRIVEVIELDQATGFINVDLVIPRNDQLPVQHHVTLTPNNFLDRTGRTWLERGLIQKASSFEKLRESLEAKRDNIIVANLSSIR